MWSKSHSWQEFSWILLIIKLMDPSLGLAPRQRTQALVRAMAALEQTTQYTRKENCSKSLASAAYRKKTRKTEIRKLFLASVHDVSRALPNLMWHLFAKRKHVWTKRNQRYGKSFKRNQNFPQSLYSDNSLSNSRIPMLENFNHNTLTSLNYAFRDSPRTRISELRKHSPLFSSVLKKFLHHRRQRRSCDSYFWNAVTLIVHLLDALDEKTDTSVEQAVSG